MDAAPSPVPEEPPARDWSLLPLDVLSSVFVKVGAFDVLMGAGLVCHSWLQAAKLPDVWRVVDMANDEIVVEDSDEYHFGNYEVLQAMAKAAVDRAGGQLQVFAGKEFVTDELVQYIIERSPSLTTLRLVSCYNFSERLADVIIVSPLSELRSLELVNVDITVEELTAVLQNCPLLEVLRVSNCSGMHNEDERALRAEFPWIESLTLEGDDYSDDDFEITERDIPDYAYFE